MDSQKVQRNTVIDIMKGIAILCVMIGHTYWRPEWLAIGIHSFHIPLFFIISGYFAKTREGMALTGGGLLRKNYEQLLLPYIIVSILCCTFVFVQVIHYGAIDAVLHEFVRCFLALDKTWSGTIFDKCVMPVWFLFALFWGRTFFYWLSKTGKWFLPLCVILSVTMILIHPYVVTPFCIGRGIEALLFMAMGYAYRRYQVPLWMKIVAIACWIVSMSLGQIDLCAFHYNCMPIDILGAAGGTLVIYYLSKGVAKTFLQSFFAWCGRNSLIILCAHSIEMNMTIIHVITKLLPFELPMMVYFGIKHVITLIGAWVYTWCKMHLPNRGLR